MKRKVTLLIENFTDSEIDELKDICNSYSLGFEFTEIKANYYHFSIHSNTEGYELLNTLMNGRVETSGFAAISNMVDLDDSFEKELSSTLELCRQAEYQRLNAESTFLRFIKNVDNVDVLKVIGKEFAGLISYKEKEMLDTEILLKEGNGDIVREAFENQLESLRYSVKDLRAKTGLTQKEFAKYFGIPYRTLQDWESEKSTCSTYLFKLMEKDLKINGLI